MNTTTMLAALGAAFAFVAVPALGADVRDESFDQESRAISEDLQRHEEVGAFGRAGDIPMREGLPANAMGDRDFDRYVTHLGIELRQRNEAADREAARVQ